MALGGPARGSAMPAAVRVVALLAAYNEEDIVAAVVADLVRQGVSVWFLDHGSTDATVAEVEPFLGRGVQQIERLPASASGEPGRVSWEAVLRRKEELAAQVDADWFIHHDADELRESPWAELDLAAAIARVDALGFDAIDFALLNFWPTDDTYRKGGDLRAHFRHFAPGEDFDRVQVRAWKRQAARVDLATSGGHEAVFPGRRVFPIRFLLRHYPFRTAAQAARKVHGERRGRFPEAERARGWHRQYDDLGPVVRDPSTLTPFDPERVRLALFLENRLVEELRQVPAAVDRQVAEARREREELSRELDQRNRALEAERERVEARDRALEAERQRAEDLSRTLDQRNRDLAGERQRAEALSRELDTRNRALEGELARAEDLSRTLDQRNRALEAERQRAEALSRELDARNREAEALALALAQRAQEAQAAQARLAGIEDSRLWRWSAPLRRWAARRGAR